MESFGLQQRRQERPSVLPRKVGRDRGWRVCDPALTLRPSPQHSHRLLRFGLAGLYLALVGACRRYAGIHPEARASFRDRHVAMMAFSGAGAAGAGHGEGQGWDVPTAWLGGGGGHRAACSLFSQHLRLKHAPARCEVWKGRGCLLFSCADNSPARQC